LEWNPDAAVTVVMAANGYPGDYRKGSVIGSLATAENSRDVTIFHAGTAKSSAGELIAAGGRVLNVCATGRDAEEARTRVYSAIGLIDWPGGFYRSDIGRLPVNFKDGP
jgi:phosphoribosylamine--glycine ligase